MIPANTAACQSTEMVEALLNAAADEKKNEKAAANPIVTGASTADATTPDAVVSNQNTAAAVATSTTSSSKSAAKTAAKSAAARQRQPQSVPHHPYPIGKYDVLCQRSREAFNHVGNRRFRLLVELYTPTYSKLSSRVDRSMALLHMVHTIRNAGGNFYTRKAQQWTLCSELQAKEKVGHAFRHAMRAKARTIYEILGDVDVTTTSFGVSNKKGKKKSADGVANAAKASAKGSFDGKALTKSKSILRSPSLLSHQPPTHLSSLLTTSEQQQVQQQQVQQQQQHVQQQQEQLENQILSDMVTKAMIQQHQQRLSAIATIQPQLLYLKQQEEAQSRKRNTVPSSARDCSRLDTAAQLVAMSGSINDMEPPPPKRVSPTIVETLPELPEKNRTTSSDLDQSIISSDAEDHLEKRKSALLMLAAMQSNNNKATEQTQRPRVLPHKKRRISRSSLPPQTATTPLSLLVVAASMTTSLELNRASRDERNDAEQPPDDDRFEDAVMDEDRIVTSAGGGLRRVSTNIMPGIISSSTINTGATSGPRRVSTITKEDEAALQALSRRRSSVMPILRNDNNSCASNVVSKPNTAQRVSFHLSPDNVGSFQS